MILNNFLIWFKVIKKYITFKYLSILTFVFLLSLFFINTLTGGNIILSFVILIIIITILVLTRLLLFYKKITDLKLYYIFLLKPANPLFGLLIYNRNPLDIFIIFPILIYINIKK